MIRRLPRHILWVALALAASAMAGEASYKQLKLQDLLGASWPEFAAELDSLMANHKNEDAFYRMYKTAQRADAESKVPQYLLKIAQDHPEKASVKALLGMFYQENRDYPQALKYFKEALAALPNDYFIHYRVAQLLGKQDGEATLKEALEHYGKSAATIGASDVELKTKMLEEWGELIVSRSDEAPEARAVARESAAIVWDRLVAEERRFDRLTYERLAQIYERHEMWAKAIGALRGCLETVVKDDNAARVRILDRVGDLSERLNDVKAACGAYNDALGLVDENHWLHKQLMVKLARCHKKIGDSAAFVEALSKLAGDRPQSTAPLRDMALVMESLDDVAATIRALERARNVSPKDVTLISDLLLLYTKSGHADAAAHRAELSRKLIELMPENFDAYVGLADVCWESGDPEKAQEALAQLRNTASTLPEKYLVMARAFKKYGMKGNARNAFELALAEDPANFDAAMELCDFCLACAEGSDATAADEALQRAGELRDALIAQNVLDESGYLRLMQVFQSHKKFDDASRIIGYAATSVFPKSFICRYALAELHYSRKEFYKAIQHYVAALDFAPSFYFKRLLNDRIVTLTYNYGRRDKNFMAQPTEEEKTKGLLGGAKGEGLAPWIFYLRALTSKDPSNADNLMLLAQINESAQVDAQVGGVPIKTDAASARALYKNVVDMDLKNLDAHAALARMLVRTDEFEGAIQENWILESLSPAGKWQYTMNVGDLWAFAGYGDKALQNWNTVREQATSEPNLVYQLSSRMYQLGKVEEAVELVRKAAAANRGEFRFRSTLGNLLDELAEANPARYDEATAEFKTAVELASQNPMLLPYLQPVRRRLLDVQSRLAHACFSARKYTEAAQICAEAIATSETMKNQAGELAGLKILRARTLLACGQRTEGEALLRDTLSAHPTLLFWYDDALKVGAQQMQSLFAAGSLVPTALGECRELPAFKLGAGKTVAVPTTIDSAQLGTDNLIFLNCRGALYRLACDTAALAPLKLSSSGSIAWVGGELAVQSEEAQIRLIDLVQQTPLWNKDFRPSNLDCGKSFVACFYKPTLAPGAQTPPAPVGKALLKLLEKKSGRELWETEAGPGEVAFGETVLVVCTASEVLALRLSDGTTAWKLPLNPNAMYRRPLVVGESLLLVNDLNNDVSAYDLASGSLRFVRSLGASLLCDPVIAGKSRVIFHILRKRIAMLQCLDLATGKLAWESGLRNIDKNIAAVSVAGAPPPPAPPLESLQGISHPPVAWNGWLLHIDPARHRIWAARLDTGDIAPPIELAGVCEYKLFDDITGWNVCGDTLYLVARTGRIALIKLVK